MFGLFGAPPIRDGDFFSMEVSQAEGFEFEVAANGNDPIVAIVYPMIPRFARDYRFGKGIMDIRLDGARSAEGRSSWGSNVSLRMPGLPDFLCL